MCLGCYATSYFAQAHRNPSQFGLNTLVDPHLMFELKMTNDPREKIIAKRAVLELTIQVKTNQ